MKLQTTLALCAGLLVAWPAAAGTLVTTYTGYVSSGVDNAGYWGLGTGASLAGQSFTAVFTIDDQAPGMHIEQDSTYSWLEGAALGVLTINGKSRSFGNAAGTYVVSNDSSEQGLFNYAADQSQHYDAGLDRLFYSFATLSLAGNGPAGALSPDYMAPFDMSSAGFSLQGSANDVDSSYDYATGVSTETVNWVAYLRPSRAVSTYTPAVGAAVPEPATWALMLAGFLGVGARIRRRRPIVA